MTGVPAPRARVAVLGAGPKAAALAAKTHVLNELGLANVELSVFERDEIGAHWTGRAGWTSGSERLGTRAEKDVGFPYRSTYRFGAHGKEIDARMQAFSWQSHLIDTGSYQQWIDAGLPSPTHRQFADYLKWVLTRAVTGVRVRRAEVTGLGYRPDGWVLEHRAAGGTGRETSYDGLVLTGHAVPGALPHHPQVAGRLLTAAGPRALLHTHALRPGSRVCVVGAGESAASCALYVADTFGEDVSVSVVSPYLPRSRAESYVEDRVYSDPHTAAWPQLPEADRRDFISRTDRGVISPRALEELSRARGVSFVLGRIRYVGPGAAGRVRVTVDQPGEVLRRDYDLVVNCTGGSPLHRLTALLDDASAGEVEACLGIPLRDDAALAREVDESLALRGLRPRLHVPGLAGLAQGPGFANLSSLGLLSDRVLGAYEHPAPTPLPARSARTVIASGRGTPE
ncbi:SidA/IucD/PvdA family monooxygenase [Streptomyces tricolor]|uniref:SidA/IucD/PvdA family monooxygenase n=1 Tax=Streptomyces tricolor TaxID=68277 RepID=UPI003D74481F